MAKSTIQTIDTLEAPVESGVEGVDSADLDLGVGRIAEKVSSSVGESGGSGSANTKNDDKASSGSFVFGDISGKISKILRTQKPVKAQKVIPKTSVQRQKVKNVLESEIQVLLRKSKNLSRYSAAQIEKIIFEIRKLQHILRDIYDYSAQKMEELYFKFVLRQAVPERVN